MNQQTLIFDLSSDDEVGFDNNSSSASFDWISKLLVDDITVDDDNHLNNSNVVADNNIISHGGDDDDSDDVVVVGEVIAKPKRAKRSFHSAKDGTDDDDCVVLDCDPHKSPAGEVKESQLEEEDEDSDDLVIIGEKGQVACRDFPHSRHLCANFPFSSTPHESRCDLCHCYVCDSLAPCAYWGSGASTVDHCHATDKADYWQLERKKFRQLKNPPVPSNKLAAASLAQQHHRSLQISARASLLSRQASNCGVSSSLAVPNIISQSRTPSIPVARSQLQPCLISRPLKSCNSNLQSNRTGCLAPRMVASRPMFKRPGLVSRSGVANRVAYCPPNSGSVTYVQMPEPHLARKPIESNAANLRVPSLRLDANLASCQPNTSSISPGTLTSQLQGYCLPSLHSPTSQFQGCGQSAAVMSDSPYIYSSVNQTHNISRPVLPCNTSNTLNIVAESSQHHSAVTANISVPNSSAPDFLSSITQRISQPSIATENCFIPSFPCKPSNTLNSVTSSGQQPLAENIVDQGEVPMHDFLSLEQNPQSSGGTNGSSLDFDIDSWFLDNDSTLGAPEGSYYDMNSQPSMSAPVDAGMLYFDFETSCKGLTHS